jgi:glutaconate CoA-transferase, subunit B
MATLKNELLQTPPPTDREVMATVISRDLTDGEWVEVGANLPVPRAGALLAHLTHGPNLSVMLAMTKAYLRNEPVIEDFEYITDVRAMRWAEAYYPHDRLLNNQRHRRNGVFYCGGIQMDRFGNSNLIGVGSDYRKLRFRGPGAIGTCNATIQCKRWHLVTNQHDPRVLVDHVDYVSALGYGEGQPGLRESLGIRNPGPASLITPLCVFVFDGLGGPAVLQSVHPGHSVEEVRGKTGFDFELASDARTTEMPSAEELRILRERIDPQGALR